MRLKSLQFLALTSLCGGLAATSALADHNSVWGAGKANMPNDIHNARVEGIDADGNVITDWQSFVGKGAGAVTENRYLDDDEAELLPSTRSMTGRVFGIGRR